MSEPEAPATAATARAGIHSRAGGLLRRVLDRVTRPPVLTVFAALQALGMLVVALRYLATLSGTTDVTGHVVTGDYPAFYTAASMLKKGAGTVLYSLQAQHLAQDALLGRTLASWQPYAYPPLLGLVLVPTAGLPYLTAFYLHDALMAAALCFFLWRLRPLLPSLFDAPRGFATAVLLVVSWHPVVRTVIGGQNTVLTLALLAGFVTWIEAGRPALAGLCLGLLSYKPQFVPLLALCLLLRRQHLALVCAAATAVAHYVLGALVSGWSWPLAWLRMMLEYRDLEWASNQYTHVSLWALFAQLLSPRWAPACAAAATLVVLWIVGTRALHATPASSFWGLAIAGTVLVSLHMQYYDAAVLLLPVLQGLEAQRRANLEPSLRSRLTLALGYVLYPIYVYGPGLGFQPLCLWAVLSFGWLASQTNAIGASELRRGSTSIRQGS